MNIVFARSFSIFTGKDTCLVEIQGCPKGHKHYYNSFFENCSFFCNKSGVEVTYGVKRGKQGGQYGAAVPALFPGYTLICAAFAAANSWQKSSPPKPSARPLPGCTGSGATAMCGFGCARSPNTSTTPIAANKSDSPSHCRNTFPTADAAWSRPWRTRTPPPASTSICTRCGSLTRRRLHAAGVLRAALCPDCRPVRQNRELGPGSPTTGPNGRYNNGWRG